MLAPRTTAAASRVSALCRRGTAVAYATAIAITALAVAACGTGSHPRAASAAVAPSCLPAATEHSAKLDGVAVDVSPAPGTATANPHSQVSFLGVPISDIGQVSVVGTRSGGHPGVLRGYSQGDGASFMPEHPFAPGERVTVRAVIGASGAGKPVEFSFAVDTPYSTAAVGPFPNPIAPPSDYQTFHTLPGLQAPVLSVSTPDRDPAAGDIFLSNGPGPGQYGPLIYTPAGQLVWFDQLSGGLVADDVSVQSYEGHRALTLWVGKVPKLGFGQGEDLVLNSHYQTVATVTGGNGLQADLHEFRIAHGDVAYITAYNPIHCDLSSQAGPRNGVITDAAIQEVDMRTGLVRWEWHALDHVNVNDSQYSPSPTNPWDWFHLNSIDPEPDGNLLISARNTWAVYQIQGGTGALLWTLGGFASSFTEPENAKTRWQHDARLLPNGDLTIYDDESQSSPPDSQSRGVTIALDFKTHRARLVSALVHPDQPLRADSQGNMQTLPSGNTLVGWGGVPAISEFAKDGSLLFDAHLPFDMIFYRAFRFPWSGEPLTPPAAAASLNNVSQTIVQMSWNGATDVAAWRVLAGGSPGSLAPQSTIKATGFESSTILPACHPYVAAQALDSTGRLLGTSHTTAVRSYAAADPIRGRSQAGSGRGSVARC